MSLFFNTKWAFFKWCNPTCPLSRVEPSPSGGQRACSRLSPSGPWLIVRGTDHLYSTPLHSLGGCNVVWFVSFWVFSPLLFVSLLLQCYSDILYPFVADSRATARTTETLSHAASRRKKLTPEWFSRLWLTRPRRTICLWICLITLFSLLAWSLMMNVFVLSQHGICPFRVVSADWSANGSEYVSWQLADKKSSNACSTYIEIIYSFRHLNLVTCPPYIHSASNQVRKVFYCQSFVNITRSKWAASMMQRKDLTQSNSKDHEVETCEAEPEKLCSWKITRWKNWKKYK